MAKLDNTTLTPSEVEGSLLAAAIAEIPLFLWGPPGVGKSDIARSVATRLNKAFVDIRLSQMDPTDVRGMPYKVEEDGVTVGVDWSAPLMFPKDLNKVGYRNLEAIESEIRFDALNPTGSNGIHYIKEPHFEVTPLDKSLTAEILEQGPAHFVVQLTNAAGEVVGGRVRYKITGAAEAVIGYEEMNSAPPSVLAACYQIILDRRIGNYVLPDGVSQFAMGNRETDKGVTFKMPTPLLNRFDHLEIRPHFEDWQAWAISALVHPDVVGYLSAFPNNMFQFTPGTASRGFATPRSWVMVSKLLRSLDAGKMNVTDTQLQAMIYGAIGDGTGAEFFEFRKIASALPSPHDVLEGRVTELKGLKKDNDRTGLEFALTTSLLYVLREQNAELIAKGVSDQSKDKVREDWFKRVDNYIEFALNNFKAEVNVMGLRSALQQHALPITGIRCKQWSTFVKKFRNVMIDS
jgi:hypothetical protein